ncbi:MAG: WG repeat-containing protein [Paludibacteraceae bacterium]|nr:WG repeat-containing protein [Paludibacteraceae bacterium]
MKKLSFFLAALVGLVLLTACDGDNGTYMTSKDKRWPAGEDGSNLWGFIDENGKMVISANYSETYNFSCGWARVKEDGEKQFIDKDGKSVIPDPFPESYFNFNRIRFEEDGKVGMYDENWKVVIPADYKSLGVCTEDGLISFSEDGKEYGYLDKDGKVVIQEQFYNAENFAGGIAVVAEEKDGNFRYGVIDKKGNFLIDYQKKWLSNMGEGRVCFYNDNTSKFGMMDKNGNELVSAKYDDIQPFTCGLALVEKNGKWGYINPKGEEVIACRYPIAYEFYDDVADVYDEHNRCSIINKKGETLFKLKEKDFLIFSFINGLGLVHNELTNQYRYINKKNEIIYKWEGPVSEEMPEKRLSPEERRMQFMLSTEYGPLFRDMMRNKEMQK